MASAEFVGLNFVSIGSAMKITDIRTIQLTRNLDEPFRNSQESNSARRFTFVLVDTDAGITGIGDAFGDAALMETILEKRLKPMAIGLDPTDIGAVWKKLFASRSFWEIGGSVVCGISAIEVACWDIRGKAEGVPVCELLGGRKRDKIEAYASDLYWEEPEKMAEKAAGYVAEGFRYVKTHIGAPAERERDLQRAAAVRKAIGPEVGFMIDINTGLDRESALSLGKDLASINPFWYEEPLAPLDIEGHAWLREMLPFKISTGENLYTLEGFEPLFAIAGTDYVMPDILRCGGIEQTRQICLEADQHGIVPSPHNFSSGVGTAATLHLMAALPETQLFELDTTGTGICDELFVDPLVIQDGHVTVPTSPGLGVHLPEAVVERWG